MINLFDPEIDLFTFFEITPDLVCIAGKDGFFRKINPAVIDKLGYTKEELFARPIDSFIHPDDRCMTAGRRARLLNGEALFNFDNRYVARNGKIVWLAWTSVYFPEKEVVFALAKDITARKQLETEIEEKYRKFKSLATHFKSSIEEDRKYLALELHEELAQLASVVKMDIDWIGSNLPGLQEHSKSRIEHASIMAELLINTIRRISFSISPNMLDDLGLNAALKWLCREFSLLNGIPCYFESSYDEADLTHEVKLDFFRICQESLANIMYHAQANSVTISIENSVGHIYLSVTDDGKGFDAEKLEQSSGITSMRGRAASINGRLTIQSESGKGTRICVAVTK